MCVERSRVNAQTNICSNNDGAPLGRLYPCWWTGRGDVLEPGGARMSDQRSATRSVWGASAAPALAPRPVGTREVELAPRSLGHARSICRELSECVPIHSDAPGQVVQLLPEAQQPEARVIQMPASACFSAAGSPRWTPEEEHKENPTTTSPLFFRGFKPFLHVRKGCD